LKKNSWWPEERRLWAPPKMKMKKVSIGKELDALSAWAFDPKTKISQLTLRGWENLKAKTKKRRKKHEG
jgi:hypothetical protein